MADYTSPSEQHPPREALLSFGQERIWFISQLDPQSTAYNVPMAVRLRGPLRIDALTRALEEMVRRHDTLRTRFVSRHGKPLQLIDSAVDLPLTLVDLSGLSTDERQNALARRFKRETGLRFDLERGPLLRISLIALAPDEYVLLLVIHHIVTDAWSAGVFLHEVGALYESFADGKVSPLPDLPIQYADHASWQREWLKGDVLEEQLRYWQDRLAGLPGSFLPTDRSRTAQLTDRGASQFVEFGEELLKSLRAVSRKEGVTVFMTLLAALQILLSRYTGQEDIVVGTPIAGRNRHETEGLIGFCVNTLAIRTDLSGNPSVAELLARVREVTLGAYTNQDIPFEKVVERLKPDRRLGRTPLVQVMFGFQNRPSERWTMRDVSVEFEALESETSKCDVSLSLYETDDRLVGTIEYSTDLFEAGTIKRMSSNFRHLLEEIVSHPGKRLYELRMFGEEERRQLVVDWNETAREYPRDKCVHALFEEQVERTPDAAAVIFGNQRVSYRELNRRANQLAHYLRRAGVGPEVVVGICVERSVEMIVGLLGILKAGGAYLPLDPAYPAERLRFMLEDAQAPVLLTQTGLAERLPAGGATVPVPGRRLVRARRRKLRRSGLHPDWT